MEKAKKVLIEIAAFIFGLFIFIGWMSVEGYWDFMGNPFWMDKYIYNIVRHITEYLIGLFQ